MCILFLLGAVHISGHMDFFKGPPNVINCHILKPFPPLSLTYWYTGFRKVVGFGFTFKIQYGLRKERVLDIQMALFGQLCAQTVFKGWIVKYSYTPSPQTKLSCVYIFY